MGNCYLRNSPYTLTVVHLYIKNFRFQSFFHSEKNGAKFWSLVRQRFSGRILYLLRIVWGLKTLFAASWFVTANSAHIIKLLAINSRRYHKILQLSVPAMIVQLKTWASMETILFGAILGQVVFHPLLLLV